MIAYQVNWVDEVTMKSLPDAELSILAHGNNVAGRVSRRYHTTVVSLDAETGGGNYISKYVH